MVTPPADESQKAKLDRLSKNLKDAESQTTAHKLSLEQAEKYEEERRKELESYLGASTSQEGQVRPSTSQEESQGTSRRRSRSSSEETILATPNTSSQEEEGQATSGSSKSSSTRSSRSSSRNSRSRHASDDQQ